MRKDSNRKAWLGVGAALSAISILGAGVAFFFLATGDLARDDSENIHVDVVPGEYGTIRAALGDTSIALLGTGEDSRYVNVDGKEDLNISFSSIDLDLSEAFVDQNLGRDVDVLIELSAPLPTLDESSDILGIREHEESYTYIDFSPVSLSVPLSDLKYDDGRFLYSFTDVVLSFTWGSFFDHLNPQIYYNDLFEGDDPVLKPTAEVFDAIVDELNAMSKAASEMDVYLKVSISVGDSDTEEGE